MYSGQFLTSNRSRTDLASGRVEGVLAPVRGLNTSSPLAGLSPDYAIVLDNWICQPDAIVTRLGAVDWVTGFAQSPKTLMTYSAGAVAKMFASSSAGIFDVSNTGVVGAAAIAHTTAFGKSVNFATSAGQYLYFLNGVDTPKLYDGAAWTSITDVSVPAITGPTTTTLFDVETYRQRLFFLQTNFLGFYYLPADSVGGAATAFRIGSTCRLGGMAVGHGCWSIDGGSGPDDHYVIATSEGEVAVYHGKDPGVVADWVLVGVYYLGKPLGQNCFTKVGGDLIYLCENGVIPLSSILQSTSLNYSKAVTNLINPTIATAAVNYSTISGWQVFLNTALALLILNVPTSTATSIQYVYNTKSKGWSSFSGWNAANFIKFSGQTYFTTGTKVVRAFSGTSDFDGNINAVCATSYNRFRTHSQLQPLMMRALYASTASIAYTIGLSKDFENNYVKATYNASGVGAGLWDSGLWDVAVWGGAFSIHKDWITVASAGAIALSTSFEVSSKTATTLLAAIDYKFGEQGLIS